MKKRIIIILLALVIPISLIWKGYQEGIKEGKQQGFTEAFDDTYKTFIENSEIKGIDFSNTVLEIDSRRLVELLANSIESKDDSLEYKFSNILYDVHSELINKYINELGLNDTVFNKFMHSYDSIHVAISTQYYEKFNDNLSESLGTPERYIIENQSYLIADEFTTIVSHGLCDIILTVSSLLSMKDKSLYKDISKDIIYAGFCSQLLQEIIPLLRQAFRSAGIYNDMHKLEMIFGEHKRQNIAQLATVEDIIPSVSVEKLQIGHKWYQSNARVKISGTSRIKAGIDLFNNFAYEVDRENGTLKVYVESPKILSIETNTVTEKVSDGIFNNVQGYILDEAKKDIEIRSRKIAIDKGLLDDSKENFERIFESIFMPVLQLKGIDGIDFNYKNKGYFEKKLKG